MKKYLVKVKSIQDDNKTVKAQNHKKRVPLLGEAIYHHD